VHRRTTMIGLLAVTTLAVGACGGSTKYANKPKPALPVNVTVYIDDARVSASPSSVGAGPVVFEVTNQSSKAESLTISGPGGSQSLASTGPITPQATAQVSVDLTSQGNYTVSTGNSSSTDASLGGPSAPRPAVVHVGVARHGAGGNLLYP
jgi:hypothetical protein